jgi:sec-independent protein translocase protein TatC
MRYLDQNSYTEDLFAHTRMPLGEHLADLQRHLWRALAGFGLILFLVFALDFLGYATGTRLGIAKPVQEFITLPLERELQNLYDRRIQKILANLDKDPVLQKANRPTAFVRLGFDRAQLLAVLQGKPAAVVNRFPRPVNQTEQDQDSESEEGRVLTEEEIYQLWVRHEEPLRAAAVRHEAERQVGRRPTLVTMSIQEGMLVYFKVGMVCGIVLGSPWIFWQIWSFVAAGLYPYEKRPFYVYLPFSLGLFLGGVLVCQFLVLPKAIEALLWFNEWLDWEPELRLNEWLGFAIWMPVVFGISFQTPLVMLLLERVGLLSVATFRSKRRLAWFLMAIFAAVITPSTDYISMLYLWLPMGLLYELGIWLCWYAPRPPDLIDLELPDAGEIIEV